MPVCLNCTKETKNTAWEKGEVCLFGMIYFCSRKCALEWVEKNKEGIKEFDEKKDLQEQED